jgi:predicted ATP-dependent serine protease
LKLPKVDVLHGWRVFLSALRQLADSSAKRTNPVTVDVWLKRSCRPRSEIRRWRELRRLQFVLRCARFGLFDLHSAGVVDPETAKGVLIVGSSGSGKSTLALQLATAGWPYLSDDELLLSLGRRRS